MDSLTILERYFNTFISQDKLKPFFIGLKDYLDYGELQGMTMTKNYSNLRTSSTAWKLNWKNTPKQTISIISMWLLYLIYAEGLGLSLKVLNL